MKKIIKKISNHELYKHKTKFKVFKKFLILILIFLLYLGFIIYEYGLEEGLLVTFLTWSFFVLCTPIADAGFLLDFPIRLVTKIKMLYSEILVWIIAISLNIFSYLTIPQIYERTTILRIFFEILSNPFPFWSIIFISLIGTFLSVFFGDELLDVAHHHQREKYHRHKNKHHLVLILFIILFTLFLYYYLLKGLNISF